MECGLDTGREAEQTMSRIWPLVWMGKSMCWVRWKTVKKGEEVRCQWGVGLVNVYVEVTSK